MQRLSSREADRLGRLSQPLLLRKGRSHDEPIGCDDVFELAEKAFRCPCERLASGSSGRSPTRPPTCCSCGAEGIPTLNGA
jgi:hypothetical protein